MASVSRCSSSNGIVIVGSVLHNPHLGLTNTLHRLYDLAKVMADCVVPQEYGTTIDEKRSVAVKICHGLLEKVKFDLNVARQDNEVDMRYLINMAYQSDLNINSLGRRVRTRLYFTSESHLHTFLSILRFAKADRKRKILSENGMRIISSTPELCYLTQIVIRVFEDGRRDMTDPRRFRAEILFSPGADNTPFHVHEQERDQDTSRFDTAPLQMIGREGLTCKEVEDFFESAIREGQTTTLEPESDNVSSSLTEKLSTTLSQSLPDSIDEQPTHEHDSMDPSSKDENAIEQKSDEMGNELVGSSQSRSVGRLDNEKEDEVMTNVESMPPHDDGDSNAKRKQYWSAVALASFAVGASFLLIALSLSNDSRTRRRSWTRRGY